MARRHPLLSLLRQPLFLLLVLPLLLASCRKVKPILPERAEIPPRSAERLLERLLAAPPPPQYYSAKADMEYSVDGEGRSFKAQLRSVNDSALWVSVTPLLGIEVARMLITQDSLHVLDKLGDRYFTGSTADAGRQFSITPQLELLQQALLGAAIGLEPGEKYRSDREDGQYVLTSREKRRFVKAATDMVPEDSLSNEREWNERRLERTLRRAQEKEAVVVKYWIDPDTYLVTRVSVVDLVRDIQADVRYLERDAMEGGGLPTRIQMFISGADRNARVSMKLSRLEFKGPLNLPFRIPEKYVRMDPVVAPR